MRPVRHTRRWMATAACAAVVSTALVASPAAAADGDLDPTFSGDGRLGVEYGSRFLPSAATSVAVQSDGKIVLAGYSDAGLTSIEITRMFHDGRIDTSFGVDGIAFVQLGLLAAPLSVLVQGGKIVVAGVALASFTSEGNVLVARLTSAGALDPTFSGDGIATVDIGTSDRASRVVAGPSGSLFVAGASDTNAFVAKVRPNGALDAGFGAGGVTLVPTGHSDVFDIQPDIVRTASGGAVIVFDDVGLAPTAVTRLVRLTSDGSLDVSFGGTGSVIKDVTAGPERGRSVLVRGNRIFAVTELEGNAWVTAFAPNGDVDTSWAVSGQRLVTIAGTSSSVNDAVFDSAGRLVIVGSSITGVTTQWALVRLLADGVQDMGIGSAGTVLRTIVGNGGAAGVALAPSGGYVLAGEQSDGLAALRLGSGGAVVTGFGDSGVSRVAVNSRSSISARDVTVHPDGKVVVLAGTVRGVKSEVTLLRYTAAGVLDPSFGSGGIVRVRHSSRSLSPDAVRRLGDGRYLVAMTMTSATRTWVVLARFTASGAPDTTFGPGGRRVIAPATVDPFGGIVLDIAADGKILVGTNTSGQSVVMRVRANGTLDPSFGSGGVVSAAAPGVGRVTDVRVLDSGRIGWVDVGNRRIGRLLANGALDETFAAGGVRPLAVPSTYQTGRAQLTGTGGISITAGLSGGDLVLARMTPDGALDMGFGVAGVVTVPAGGGVKYVPTDLVLRADGSVVIVGYATPSGTLSAVSTAVIRVDSSGALDPTFSGDGIKVLDLAPGANDLGAAVSVRATSMVVASFTIEAGQRLFLARILA